MTTSAHTVQTAGDSCRTNFVPQHRVLASRDAWLLVPENADGRRRVVPPAALDEYAAGYPLVVVAKRYGCAPQTLRKALEAAGVSIRPRGAPRGPRGIKNLDRAEEFKRRYLGGETLEAIGGSHGITRERVRQILRAIGVQSLGYRKEHLKQAQPLTAAEQEAARLYEQGVHPRKIQRRCGVTAAQLSKARKRLGVQTKAIGHWQVRPDDAEITARVAELYLAGVGATEIARRVPQLKFPETVYRYLKKAGVTPRYVSGPHSRLRP